MNTRELCSLLALMVTFAAIVFRLCGCQENGEHEQTLRTMLTQTNQGHPKNWP